MRSAFMEALAEAAAADERVCLVVGDLGYSVIEDFAERFPHQFVNVGVSEQNMTGLAAGLAKSGKIVFTYSIANFSTIRPMEQIRNDVCYHGLPVRIVAVGGGLAYGSLGMTHHATEDLALMRCLPGMTVVAPGDPIEARLATRELIHRPGPAYLRLGKTGEPAVHSEGVDFRLGRSITVREGSDIALIATGGMLATAVAVARQLAVDGVESRVISMHTVQPLDDEAIRRASVETRCVVTLEEHGVNGGLGGAVAEVMAEMPGPHAPLARIGLRNEFIRVAGDQSYLRTRSGLDAESIIRFVRSRWAAIKGTALAPNAS